MSDEADSPERPATFREVFAQSDFRSIYLSSACTVVADSIAKAAVTLTVFTETRSVALSATAFAIGYLPWLIGGPLLTTLADRYPYRRVMVISELIRMIMFALVTVMDLRAGLLVGLLFVSTLTAAPALGARSALLPLILRRDRLVVGLSLLAGLGQVAQVGGYLIGAGLATINPRVALVVTAALFGASALVLRIGLAPRPVINRRREHLLSETAQGFRMIFHTPVLRAVALLVFSAMFFAIVPEGLAAAWAASIDEAGQGLGQGLIMAASPLGFVLGSLLVGRLVRPDLRRAMIRPFAVLAPFALAPALFDPPAPVVAIMAAVSGFAIAGMLPAANALFARALPHGFRARAFGVMQTGMALAQGFGVAVTGLLADRFSLPHVVGVWSLVGVGLLVVVARGWPAAAQFEAVIAANQAMEGRELAPQIPVPAMVEVQAASQPGGSLGAPGRIDTWPQQPNSPAPAP